MSFFLYILVYITLSSSKDSLVSLTYLHREYEYAVQYSTVQYSTVYSSSKYEVDSNLVVD